MRFQAGFGVGNIDPEKPMASKPSSRPQRRMSSFSPIRVIFHRMHAEHLTLALPDEADTLALGAPGSAPGAGHGGLARRRPRRRQDHAGARPAARAGETGPVKSPTYTLVEVHVVSGLNFYHFDFYRFNQAEEYLDAGSTNIFQEAAICLVEWPDKAAPYLPPPICESNCASPAGQGDGTNRPSPRGSERGRTCLAGVMSSSSLPPA
jgi:tRNA threonylcarbamoyladenosine biosynthesis protein TsaE